MESKRVYENGLQVGTETHWYDNGKKRLELVYMGGAVTSLKQWDPDGNEQGE
jgi:antitoxin component YwqK of YwqJK toxin-antitoxin module